MVFELWYFIFLVILFVPLKLFRCNMALIENKKESFDENYKLLSEKIRIIPKTRKISNYVDSRYSN